jgi:MipA family protein
LRFLLAAIVALVAATSAFAQQPTDEWIFGENGEDIVLELGGGGKFEPAYEGSDEYELRPWPVVDLKFLRVPVLGTFGGGPETALSIGPSFGFIGERDDDDYSEITGLGDVDFAVEVGGRIAYRYGMFRAVAAVRQGFGGHDGIVGEGGVDLVVEPIAPLTVSIGPRVSFASDDYMETYFGVDAAQSAASGLPVFGAEGGIRGAGVEAEWRYALTRRWALVGEAGYERLVGDAADSPVTEAGSANQFSASLGLTYRFGLDFYD